MNRKTQHLVFVPTVTRQFEMHPEGKLRLPLHGRKTSCIGTNNLEKADDRRPRKIPDQVCLVESTSSQLNSYSNRPPTKPTEVLKERPRTANPTQSTVGKTFGFLRPTKSSLAKCKPVGKCTSNSTIETTRQNDVTAAFKRPFPVPLPPQRKFVPLKKPVGKTFCSTANSSRQGSADTPLVQDEFVLQVQPKIPFQIFESETSEDTIDLSVSAIEKPKSPPNSARFSIQRLVETPKFPCTRSTEKKTKRKLQFRPIVVPDTSPPPSFDFTINQATQEPRSVLTAKSYDVFSTPILNLSTVLTLDSNDESVYYTPCAET